MSSLSELLYKLNKYQTLLKLNDSNKEAYQKKIYSYTNKINNIQVGGATQATQTELQNILAKIQVLNVEELTSKYNEIFREHANIDKFIEGIDTYIQPLFARIRYLEEELDKYRGLGYTDAAFKGFRKNISALNREIVQIRDNLIIIENELATITKENPANRQIAAIRVQINDTIKGIDKQKMEVDRFITELPGSVANRVKQLTSPVASPLPVASPSVPANWKALQEAKLRAEKEKNNILAQTKKAQLTELLQQQQQQQ
jgi:hypothetical protein